MVRLAIPSEGQGGLDGMRAGHFGHCDVFTCIDVENGQIKQVSILPNREHVQGGCMVPVNLLAEAGVNALVVVAHDTDNAAAIVEKAKARKVPVDYYALKAKVSHFFYQNFLFF